MTQLSQLSKAIMIDIEVVYEGDIRCQVQEEDLPTGDKSSRCFPFPVDPCAPKTFSTSTYVSCFRMRSWNMVMFHIYEIQKFTK